MFHVVWAEEPKTGLGFEIGPPQQTRQRKPTVQFLSNPAVIYYCTGVHPSRLCIDTGGAETTQFDVEEFGDPYAYSTTICYQKTCGHSK